PPACGGGGRSAAGCRAGHCVQGAQVRLGGHGQSPVRGESGGDRPEAAACGRPPPAGGGGVLRGRGGRGSRTRAPQALALECGLVAGGCSSRRGRWRGAGRDNGGGGDLDRSRHRGRIASQRRLPGILGRRPSPVPAGGGGVAEGKPATPSCSDPCRRRHPAPATAILVVALPSATEGTNLS